LLANETRGTRPADPGRVPDLGASIARGAAVVAGLTIVCRLLGLVRTLVFSQAVGATCLGGAYVTANQVPNLLYELVLGGALTSAMVPVLARSAGLADRDPEEKARVGEITSALLTWSVIVLVPLVVIIAAAAGPIASLLTPANSSTHCVRADVVATTSNMLVVFAPQALLYGLSVVLFGLLQSYRRFAAPSIAPGISSLVLIASYLAFASLSKGRSLGDLPITAELVLAVGSTLGVAALVVVALLPTRRLHLRFRPILRFPPGVAPRAGGLALVGFIELVALELTSVVGTVLANGRGETGAVVLLGYASQVFNSVSAILVVSIVVSTFPVLFTLEGREFDRTCAGSTRSLLLMSWLSTTVVAAIAVPAAHVLAKQPDQVSQLLLAFLLFAVGLPAIAVTTNLCRVMFVVRRLKVAAAAVVGTCLLVMAADVVMVELVPSHLVVPALALGNTLGNTVVAIPMVIVTRRICGKAAVQGVSHAALAGLAAGAVGSAVGLAISMAVPVHHKLEAFAVAVPAACGAIIAFGVVAYLLDDGDLKVVVAWLRRALRPRSLRGSDPVTVRP
jgi:putative peptidoglycan lipid II flippase